LLSLSTVSAERGKRFSVFSKLYPIDGKAATRERLLSLSTVSAERGKRYSVFSKLYPIDGKPATRERWVSLSTVSAERGKRFSVFSKLYPIDGRSRVLDVSTGLVLRATLQWRVLLRDLSSIPAPRPRIKCVGDEWLCCCHCTRQGRDARTYNTGALSALRDLSYRS
jgi:hypothetical protein